MLAIRLLLIGLFVGHFGMGVLIAQNGSPDTVKIEKVTISATRDNLMTDEIPASVSVIDKPDLQGVHSTLSLEESLRAVPGVFVNNRHNPSLGERLMIRGLGSRAQYGIRNVKVVLDGIPLTFPDGTTQINNLDPGYVGRMEILRGPASTLYGNAAGGVMYLETERPPHDTVAFVPRLTVGSFALLKFEATLNVQAGKTSYFVNAGAQGSNGYRDYAKSHTNHINGLFKYKFGSKTKLTLILNGVQSPYLLNPSSLTKEDMEEDPRQVRQAIIRQAAGKAVTQGQAGLRLEQQIGIRGKLESTAYAISRNLYNPIFGRIIDLKRISGGLHNVYRHSIPIGSSTLTLRGGLDAEWQWDQRMEFDNPGLSDSMLAATPLEDRLQALDNGDVLLSQDENISSLGTFAVVRWQRKWLTLSAGLRGDWFKFQLLAKQGIKNIHSAIFHHWSPSAGAMIALNEWYRLYANYSTAFQTPTANEFSNDPSGDGFNENLRPETIESVEVGARRSGRHFSGSITGFYFVAANQLIPYQASGQSEVTYYRNAGKTSNKGLELWLTYQPNSRWSFETSFTAMNYVFEEYKIPFGTDEFDLGGNKVPAVPAHRWFTNVNYRHPSGIAADLDVQYVGKYYAQDMNIITPPNLDIDLEGITNDSYWVTDFRLGYEMAFKKFSLKLFGGINNLLDTHYSGSVVPNAFGARFFEPAPGRNFYLGVEIPIRE